MYTSTQDVATELGRALSVEESAQVGAWITRVESRIEARIPDLTVRVIDAGYLDRLVGVVVDVVARKVRNPEGLRTERVDDYYYDRGPSATADLTLTDGEWAELLPANATGAFSTRPRFEPDGVPLWP